MRKKVKEIKILSVPFKVEYWDGELPKEPGDENYEEGTSIQGRYYAKDHKILISDDLSKDRCTLVMLHELLHGYDDLMRIKDGDDALTDAECDRLSLVIFDILKNGVV